MLPQVRLCERLLSRSLSIPTATTLQGALHLLDDRLRSMGSWTTIVWLCDEQGLCQYADQDDRAIRALQVGSWAISSLDVGKEGFQLYSIVRRSADSPDA